MIEEGLIDEKGFIEVKSVKICVRGILHDPLVLESWIDEINWRGIIGFGEIGVIQNGRIDEFHL